MNLEGVLITLAGSALSIGGVAVYGWLQRRRGAAGARRQAAAEARSRDIDAAAERGGAALQGHGDELIGDAARRLKRGKS
jgi:hypothetical protein